jgi:hypothetical protein
MEGDRWPLEPEWIYEFPVEEEVFAYDWATDPRPFDNDLPEES